MSTANVCTLYYSASQWQKTHPSYLPKSYTVRLRARAILEAVVADGVAPNPTARTLFENDYVICFAMFRQCIHLFTIPYGCYWQRKTPYTSLDVKICTVIEPPSQRQPAGCSPSTGFEIKARGRPWHDTPRPLPLDRECPWPMHRSNCWFKIFRCVMAEYSVVSCRYHPR